MTNNQILVNRQGAFFRHQGKVLVLVKVIHRKKNSAFRLQEKRHQKFTYSLGYRSDPAWDQRSTACALSQLVKLSRMITLTITGYADDIQVFDGFKLRQQGDRLSIEARFADGGRKDEPANMLESWKPSDKESKFK